MDNKAPKIQILPVDLCTKYKNKITRFIENTPVDINKTFPDKY